MKLHRNAVVCLCALAVVAAPICADEVKQSLNFEFQGAYDLPNHSGYGLSDGSFAPLEYGVLSGLAGQRTVGSTWGGAEAQAIIDQNWTIPLLAGEDSLTKDNNLALDLSGELSPVSAKAVFEATLTPIAFLKLSAGGRLGTGWDIGFTGLGYFDSSVNRYVSSNFGGLVCQAWVSGTFQFDLAALMPGDWNHVVVLASPKVQYQYCSLAKDGQAWMWEADDGTDFNGLKLKGSYVLAYQMPLQLSMVGVLVEPEGYIGSVASSSTMASGGWGSDATILGVSGIFNIKLSDKASIAILPQIKRKILWTTNTLLNQDLATRKVDGANAYYWYFNHIAFDFNLKL
jgi:hypothetical protein